jgi:glyoxylase-like metal-dependent hydrolase (beta-lactamase superfamily II)
MLDLSRRIADEMPMTSSAISAARAAATVLATLAVSFTAAAASPSDSPEAAEAARVFCAYVEARNRQDFRQASALVSDDVRWLDTEGRNHPKNDARLEPMIAWEGAMGGKWTCRVLGYADGWLEAEVSEQNRMYDALDVGAIVQRDRVRVEGGRIREGRTLAEWSTGRDEDDAFGEFKKWLAALPEERRAGLLRDGSLVYDGETARREQPLLEEWQKAHPPAWRLLSETLDALGGADRVARLDLWIVEGKGRENLSAELQGLSAEEPTWRPHEESLGVVVSSGSVAWQRRTPRNDQSLRWRRFIFEPKGFGVVDFNAGYGVKRQRETPEAQRQALMRRFPHLLILEAATRAQRLVTSTPRTRDGTSVDTVEATLSHGSRVRLLLSRAPRALAGVEYAVYLPGLGDSTVLWEWTGWKKDAVVGMTPSGHRITVNGVVFQEVTYSRYTAGSSEAAEMMEVPKDLVSPSGSGPRANAPPPSGPATGEVAPGVHVTAIRGFVTTFVEFADFVVLFDAPASAAGLEAIPADGSAETERVTEELLATIARTCPGKPVRFVVVSHHHSDHLGGLRAFAGRDVTILAAPGEVAAARRALTAPHALAPDRWTGDGRETMIEAVPDRRSISDGRRRLEVINVGTNPHTKENLFAWLPVERLLFQGDLFYYEEGAPFPPSGRETMNRFFAAWLAAHGLSPKAIYGAHYTGAAPPDALELAARQ